MGKNQSASNLINIFKQDSDGSVSIMHGSTMLMEISSSGAITTTGIISGSNALSASYAESASAAASAVTAVTAQTASFVANAQTASFIALAQSASNAVVAQTASYADTLTVAGTLTAQTLVVQTITSSVDFVTGSTRFGSILDNTHKFTGSVGITGSSHSIIGDLGIGINSPSENFHVQNDEGYLTLLYKASGSDTIISSNYHTYDEFGTRYGYETTISAYEYRNTFYQPFSGYFGRSGSSTYFMKFDSGYPSASLQRTLFQLNGNDKLVLLESGEIVIGPEGYSDIAKTSWFPPIIRGAEPVSYMSDISGSNLTIQGGRGRGTGYGGDIIFKTANGANESSNTLNTAQTRMVIKGQGGNVGIANSNPQQKLSVGGDGRFSGNLFVGSGYRVEFVDEGTTSYSWIEGSSYNRAYSFLSFNTSGSEKMRITSDGYLGIGTTNPLGDLHVSNATNVSTYIVSTGGDYDTNLYLGYSGSYTSTYIKRVASNLVIGTTNNDVLTVSYDNKVGIGTTSPNAQLNVGHNAHGIGLSYLGSSALPSLAGFYTSDGTAGGQTSYGSLLVKARTDYGGFYSIGFYTAASNNTPVERMRIASSGNVGIGTTPNHKLDVNGDINIPGTNKIVFNNEPSSWFLQARTTTSTANLGSGLKNLFYNGGGANEGIAFSGVGTGAASMEVRNDGRVWVKENLNVGGTITESSSIRYKTNIETVKYGLDKVLQLRGVTYDKKDTGVKELGLIAEEVNEILPDVVIKNEEGQPDSVSYGRLTAVLIEAVKDLQAQINELKAK